MNATVGENRIFTQTISDSESPKIIVCEFLSHTRFDSQKSSCSVLENITRKIKLLKVNLKFMIYDKKNNPLNSSRLISLIEVSLNSSESIKLIELI